MINRRSFIGMAGAAAAGILTPSSKIIQAMPQATTELNKVKTAILKENSPSCGVHFIYNIIKHEKFKTTGKGVATAILQQQGLRVISEEELDQI